MKKISSAILFICVSFLTVGCNVSQVDEAVNDSENPEVANLVKDNDDADPDASTGRLEVADEVADQITDLKGIDHAWVFVSEENAYVAVDLNDAASEEVPKEVKEQVTEQVMSSDIKDVQHVYVSSNPDFKDRLTAYGKRIEEGEPVEGLADEFNEMVERVFPNQKTSGSYQPQ
ncbi:YhcN/YlaJ family sporulation lipoprotein [Jeotgalibacillus sp. S-D1]|uniref:YhcN/YlaJ family sporulation lipoprotein n=1 Tax=Jeotgalibacillus sp. S-D1 TaxID=2552189 RepID=UPI001059A535|nr:YhcN/YlaJ family sporulation lipoprotein [Jeotgalibacillus sp. S-D1]TDL30758.1 YhcN/YlaJ family sporulation lipoprotein [Jeotgalibacillus sp. S-D1]